MSASPLDASGTVTPAATGPEVSWFSALCDDDYEFLGVPDPALASSYEHCRSIVLAAQANGFDNVLLPSGYALGIDSVAFAGAVAPEVDRMRLLVAVRCGELWPPQLARQLATLDQLLHGRLTVNIISSDLPGQQLDSGPRYRRTLEVMGILRDLLDGKGVDLDGEFHRLTVEPPRVGTVSGRCPPLYFGGLSDPARDVAARAADVFLMWPDTEAEVSAVLEDMRARAGTHGRSLRFGYRVHVIVRETEAAARAAARRLVSRLDDATGTAIRSRSLDSASAGVRRQAEMRDDADDEGFVEDCLWTGIGRGRSGAGAALVGDPDQVLAKLRRYQQMGMDNFILSGYPHLEECDWFGRLVLAELRGGAASSDADRR
jgi:alkanesulfonate monooxygenase